jgi:hypothetical protein
MDNKTLMAANSGITRAAGKGQPATARIVSRGVGAGVDCSEAQID